MKKNSRVRRLLAVILCMTLVLSSNIVSMAAEENGTEVQELTETPVIEETEPVVADEPVPEDITETETPVTETPETVPTEEPVDTEVPTETVTEPETPETPAQDETEKPAEMGTPAAPEAPGAQEEPGAGDQSVEVVGYVYIESTDGEYPPYLTADDMGTSGSKYTAHNATIKKRGVKDPGYEENSDGTFECLHTKNLGERNKHYAVLKYSSSGSEISYIRCDLFGGEDPKEDYYAVFFKDAETNQSIIAGEGEFFEIVKKGESATRIPNKTNGYWTLGEQVGKAIQNEDELAKVKDRDPEEKVDDPKTYKINEQTVFIWHENPAPKVSLEFKKIAEDTNKALQGASFQLTNGTNTKNATSDNNDGKVRFNDLEPGDYTLTETNTPEGYVKPTNAWSVNIDSNGNITITGGDEGLLVNKTESDGYKIINRVENPLSCNKMVEVENEDNRTFQISLTIDSELSAEKKVSKIVDVIDSRFELVSGEKERLEEKYPNNISFETLKNNDLKITWTNNAAIIKPDNKGQHGWEEIIHIKAKDDFMGGNMIPTNGSNSGIYVDGDETIDLEFQKPTVNVKLLTITAEDITETVFLGDMINATQFPQELLEKVKIQKITKETFNIPSGCLPESLSSGHSVTKEYSYGSTNDVVGSFMYEFKPIKPENNSVTDHKADVVGENVEQYQLTVTYEAKNRQPESGYLKPVGLKQDQSKVTSKYTIDVVSGKIEITKMIDGTFNPQLEGDPIFTFKIEKLGNNQSTEKTWYRTVRFTNSTEKEKTVEVLGNLEKGDYRVTELETGKYKPQSVVDAGSTCTQEPTNTEMKKEIIFHIGTPLPSDKECLGKTGKVTFTNEKKGESGKRTDTDVKVNRFTKTDGKWTWEGYTVPPGQKKDSKQ